MPETPPVDPEVRRRRLRRIAAVVVVVWVVIALVAATRHRAPDPEYAFIDVLSDGAPVSYPCGPIGLVVDPTGAPDDWRTQVDDALAALASASDYDVSDTTGTPATDRGPAIVHLRWSDEDADSSLAGPVLGRGGSYRADADARHYGGGRILLDTEGNGTYTATDRQATLQHELGHVLGLDHVSSPYEIMSTGQEQQTYTYGPGDRIGLARLYDASCPTDS